ncbi:MAG: hypothetical protein WCG02_03545 [Candidatus Taylorbacteria bacterium]
MKKYIIIFAVLVISLGSARVAHGVTQNTPVPLSGWGWSSTTGWVSFSSKDNYTGTNGIGTSSIAYGVTIATSSVINSGVTGRFAGYAWSSNIGWISFNYADVIACGATEPSSVDLISGAVIGWARVMSEKDRSDGWDGCISLSGTNFASPVIGQIIVVDSLDVNHFVGKGGVTLDVNTSKFKGFSWSGVLPDPASGINAGVLGWLSFDNDVKICFTKILCPDAVVSQPKFTLRVQVSGAGTGKVTVKDNAQTPIGACDYTTPITSGGYTECQILNITTGTVLTLSATAYSGSQFGNWTGACTETICTVTMTGNNTVKANFTVAAASTYTLTVDKIGKGSGSVAVMNGTTSISPDNSCLSNTCTYSNISKDAQLTLTPTASNGSMFSAWSGCDVNTACNVTMSNDKTVTAKFALTGTVRLHIGTDNSKVSTRVGLNKPVTLNYTWTPIAWSCNGVKVSGPTSPGWPDNFDSGFIGIADDPDGSSYVFNGTKVGTYTMLLRCVDPDNTTNIASSNSIAITVTSSTATEF